MMNLSIHIYILLLVFFIFWAATGLFFFYQTNKEASAIKKSILKDKAMEELHGKITGWEFMMSHVQTAAENQALIQFLNEREARPVRFYLGTGLKFIFLGPVLLYAAFVENRSSN